MLLLYSYTHETKEGPSSSITMQPIFLFVVPDALILANPKHVRISNDITSKFMLLYISHDLDFFGMHVIIPLLLLII
jgi:hypothetical protein